MPQRRYKFLRQRASIPNHVQSICRNQRKRVQKIREGQLVPDHLRRSPRFIIRIYDDTEDSFADIVERFSLSLMLFFVAFRNLIELSGSEFDFSGGMFLPQSFGWIGGSVLWTISYVGIPPTVSN